MLDVNQKAFRQRTGGLLPSVSKLLSALVVMSCAVFSSQDASANNVDGAWSQVYDWPLISIHVALTPDGRVLTYGTDGVGKQTGYFIYDIWDPNELPDAGHMTLNNMTLTDIFCSSQIILPQSAEILIAGGDNWTGANTTNTGNNNTNIFNPSDNTLARSINMNRARWYSSSTVLINGEIYIQGGNGGADLPEVRQLDGSYRLLTSAPTNGLAAVFPRNFLAPDGRIFGYDTQGRMYFIDASGSGSRSDLGQFSSAYAGWTSSTAMFSPGRIVQFGGNSNNGIVIDINGPVPTVTPTGSNSSQRKWVNATLMADGRVLATGGSQAENQLSGVNNDAEIWDPATGLWYSGATGSLARLYHSSALLLPDGRVAVLGGGAPGPLVNTNVEIYSPPYLFDNQGVLATQPLILSAPDTANVGDTLTVTVDSNITRVTFVKTGSVTHSFNMDQRFVELPFTSSSNTLFVTLPVRSTDTPPGFYQMFVFNDSGVPSQAKMVRINIDPTPNMEVDYTPTMGGGGGSAFRLACPAAETVVGVHGNSSTYVNQIGPQCVKFDQLGRWIGDPVNGPLVGTTTTGTSFNKSCPRDFAVSGFRGNAGSFVDQIEIECAAVTPAGVLTGVRQFLGADGGPGGTPQGPFSCGTNNPVSALYGRSGSLIDSVGVECRPAPITQISINSIPAIVNPGNQSGVAGEVQVLPISASDSDGDPLTFSATGLPTGLSIDPATGVITGTPTNAGTYNVTISVTDGTDGDSESFVWDIAVAPPLSVDPMPQQPPALVDSALTYTATANGGINVQYKWNFGDGNPETAYSGNSSIVHTFSQAGIYYVTLTVNDDLGVPSIQTFAQIIFNPLTANAAMHSSSMAYGSGAGGNARIWVVNQDNDSVSVFDTVTNTRIAEISVGNGPRTLAIAPDGRIWVANKFAANISVIDPAGLSVVQTISLPFAAQPYGIVFSPANPEAFVVLEGTGQLLKLDASTGASLGFMDVGTNVRHLSINGAGTDVYVSRFITPPQPGEDSLLVQSEVGGVKVGGEIEVIDAINLTWKRTIVLQHSAEPDSENSGGGVPNYLGPLVISPDGTFGMVPSKMDNIGRGIQRNGADLNFQNTVRAISSYVDNATDTENYARRIDHDNSSVTSAFLFEQYGVYGFAALETSQEVAVIDMRGSFELFRFDTGRAPQGLTISADGLRLYVNNFMDRTVSVFDLSNLLDNGQWNVPELTTMQSIVSEKLSAQELTGKQLFYDARDTRLARDRYLSCATCHNDGGQDGRVWDLSGFGEGLRNTISLRGTAASNGPLHWTENFDEIQDFEGQIRALSGGTGLMADADFNTGTRSEPLGDPKGGISSDLDALATYVASLDQYSNSPYRNADGSLTAAADAGRTIFARENCAVCHSGPNFTDSAPGNLHDIGTLKSTSGMRLGLPLTGIDTPTLLSVWNTYPYLHDGSAATLSDAIAAHNSVALMPAELSQVATYLQQLDSETSVGSACAGCEDFSGNPTTSFSNQDISGAVTILDAGASIRLDDNTWRKTIGTYDITPDTLLEFTFTSTSEGEIHAIGFDTDNSFSTGRLFQLYGTQISGSLIQVFNTYSGPAPESFSIAVGQYYTGTAMQLVLVNDQDNGSGSNGTFSNIRVYENVVAPPGPLPPTIDNPGNQTNRVNTPVSLTITASDPNGDALTFSAAGLPPNLVIDPNSGEVTGSATSLGTSVVMVTVDDGFGGTDIATFNWTIVAAPTCADCVDFSGNPTTSFSNQDISGIVTILDAGASIRLEDNTWRKTIGTYDITPDTVLEFAFASSSEGEIHGIGFDTDNSFSSGRIFQLYGTQIIGSLIQDFNTYSGPAPASFSIAVGQYYTGTAMQLLLVNDQDNGSGSNGTFSNIRVYENVVAPPGPLPPTIDNPGNQTSRVSTPVSLTITASDPNGDALTFSAAGLPPDLVIDPNSGEVTGSATSLGTSVVMVTVNDGFGGTDVATFDWTIVEAPTCADCVDFSGNPTTSFSNQDISGTVTILDAGASIRLEDNTWRKTIGTYDISSNTVLEFTFTSTSEGEIHGIGFDSDNSFSSGRIFQVHGTQIIGSFIQDFNTYSGPVPESFSIAVGQYYTGTGMQLLLVNDQDNGSGSNGTFSNVRIYVP